jgi:hypothetical protein
MFSGLSDPESSSSKNSKKKIDDFLSWKNDVNVPSKSTVISKKT